MRRPPRSLLSLPLLALLAVASCGDADVVATDDGDSPALDGRRFWSVSVTEDGVARELVAGTLIELSFDGDQVGASAGCNHLGGRYHLDGSTLVVEELAMTEMGCDPERHAQDEFVAELLVSRPVVELAGDDLRLRTDTVTVELLDKEVADPDRPFVGTRWTVTGFIQGDVAVSMAVGTEGWIELSDESTLQGHDGCTEFTMPVEYSDGRAGGPVEGDGELQFGSRDPAPDTAGCADAEYVEAFVAGFASGSAVITIDGPNLTLMGADGNGVTFRDAAG